MASAAAATLTAAHDATFPQPMTRTRTNRPLLSRLRLPALVGAVAGAGECLHSEGRLRLAACDHIAALGRCGRLALHGVIEPTLIATAVGAAAAICLSVAAALSWHALRAQRGAAAPGRREAIPERVRHEVWRRDGGECVDCRSRERLEFDHIIPLSRGGSSSVRNLELRCERCNRRKGARI